MGCAGRWFGGLCASVALLMGCGGGADGGAPTAPFDGDPQQGLGAAGTVTLDVPQPSFRFSGHIGLQWSGSGAATVFTVWFSAADGQPFVEVAANVSGDSADFDPGPSWKIDFPTALVRVRGCNAGGDLCSDSNVQPLADALVASRPSLIPSVDPSTSTVGGSSRYVIDDAGRTIAALRSTELGMFGNPAESFSPARVDLYGPAGNPFSVATPDYRGTTGTVAISGDGNTLAIPLGYSYGGSNGPLGVAGVVVVYYNDRTDSTDGRSWRLQAVIEAPPSLGLVENLGAGLQLSDDGRRLAATATELGSVLVFDKQPDATWKLQAQIPGAANRHIAMSGNGRVIAFGALAGNTPSAHYEVRVHECACGDAWPLRATLRSDEFPYAGTAALDDFGDAPLALSDDGRTLAVGAPRSRSTTRAGSVYVFGDTGGQWQRQAHFVSADEPGPDLFGLELSLSGNGRVLAASACGRFAPASGVNRNYASSTPPVSDEPCNPTSQQTGLSHGAHVFQRDDAGMWKKAASVVPTLPPTSQTDPLQWEMRMIPRLDRDGGTMALGAYRDADPFDTQPGEANLLLY